MKSTLLIFKPNGAFYANEEFEIPDETPGYDMQSYVTNKLRHQYADMVKVVIGEDIVPVMVPVLKR